MGIAGTALQRGGLGQGGDVARGEIGGDVPSDVEQAGRSLRRATRLVDGRRGARRRAGTLAAAS